MQVGGGDAALGGLQVIAQPGQQVVGVDAVCREAQVVDDRGGWCEQRVIVAARGLWTHGAPQRVQPEDQARAPARDECADTGDRGGDRQAGEQRGAGVPGVQQSQGGHGSEGYADAERDDHRQPQRFVEQDVGVDGGVVHPVEQLRGLCH